MHEQRAFAAVLITPSGALCVVPSTVRHYASEARKAAAGMWMGGWEGAKRRGWRIRPVLIRVEDNGGKDD